jgi:hypothetical protein
MGNKQSSKIHNNQILPLPLPLPLPLSPTPSIIEIKPKMQQSVDNTKLSTNIYFK